ncbi:MAG: Smr/MutS family protein [Rhizobiaceae bacterium]|nr:Smr/MutS family protein [Rhizobiaceae bacterium]
MSKGKKKLSDEDRVLWGQVAKTIDAFPGRMDTLFSLDDAPASGSEIRRKKSLENPVAKKAAGSPALSVPKPAARRHGLNPIDKPVHKKIASGRVPLEARIDLHGLTQDAAHHLLLNFLISAHQRGLRHVLVITGKGASFGSEGVLRRAVPQWLHLPEFRGLASGCEPAARGHGGDGALYIRIKRKAQDR